MKTFATALALIVAVGCASTPATQSTEGGSGRAAGFTNNVKNAPDYILLSSPNQIRTYDFSSALEPRGLHVRGVMTNRGFMPAGEIQGSGKFCADGKDWLSLSELKIHKESEGKTPEAPYIIGCASNAGFQPASRAIVTQ
jgi:hypothetical protein